MFMILKGKSKPLRPGNSILFMIGSWLHCGYHLTSSVVSPAALFSLPFAVALLGWVFGLICLTMGGLVTFYSNTLLSVVLEHHAQLGQRQLRYRDMARDILGPRWGKYLAGPLQLGLCSGRAVAQILLGGESLHAMAKGVLSNFMGADQKPLLPSWFLLMTNVFILLQVSATALIYLQPINEELEKTFANPNRDQFSARYVVPRVIFRSIAVIIGFIAFFGDIMAVLGSFAFIPLDLILPMVFYNVTFKPSKHSLIFGVNTFIAIVSSVLTVAGAVASVRQLVLDSKTYHLVVNISN
ncbi:GABA transporter 1 [Morella rubra]|uniref:GABA transporter 1 n=1 Tax=Morella rubra TaxID=262757 RepID=A0A6A1WNK0_9ROSI|nr:GABA transporter 1 [Morella rubra]